MFAKKTVLVVPVFVFVALASRSADAATPTYYDSLMNFQVDVTSTVTDDYSNPGYAFQQSNAVMNAVLGETDYFTTGFMDWNLVPGGYYCAGCNGSFQLIFTTTSVGDATGVNGVGMDISFHDLTMQYYAYIIFADGTTDNVALPASGNFWGVSAPERIESIHFGLSGGASTTGGSFGIDNLIVGDGFDATPCGDGITDAPEQCDDAGESATCDPNCTFASCGDNTLNVSAGEACDEGGATATCNADCTLPACGDSVVNMLAGEECDDGSESAACDADCSFAVCGDGLLNATAGEACDDSAESPTCDADCTLVVCGDGTENNIAGEYCDDGNMLDGDGCSSTCTVEEPPVTTTSEGSSSDGGSSGGDGTTTDATTGAVEGSSDGGVDTSGGETTGGASAGVEDSGSLSGADSATASAGESGGDTTGIDSGGARGSNDTGGCGCASDDRDAPTWLLLTIVGVATLRRRRA
jgi:MYXO-CTERM domain-containing protein